MTSISLIVPVYNLSDSRIRNLLQSIQCQTVKPETILVDYGSTEENYLNLKQVTDNYDAELIHVSNVTWSPPRACNIGIKKAGGEIIVKIDADLILESKTVEDTIHQLVACEGFVIRQPLYLPQILNLDRLQFPRDYQLLKRQKTHYQLPSYGGFFAAPSEWWHKIRGYDERYTWYGCNDWDLWNRAIHCGLKRYIFGEPDLKGMKGITAYNSDSRVYHQWHQKPWIRLGITEEQFTHYKEKNREIYNNSHTINRNQRGWGEQP